MASPEFHYYDPFPLGPDDTSYRLLSKEGVSVSSFEGHEILGDNTDGAGLAQDLTRNLGGEAKLVLHGTSSLSEDQMHDLAADGVIRVNMWTRIVREAGQVAAQKRHLFEGDG